MNWGLILMPLRMKSLMLHWEMQGGHRSGRKKAENDTEAEKND